VFSTPLHLGIPDSNIDKKTNFLEISSGINKVVIIFILFFRGEELIAPFRIWDVLALNLVQRPTVPAGLL
jgi:hypothetical protein